MIAQHPTPIIIFGAPRSGTTFVNQLLNSHPQIHVTVEMRVFSWLLRAVTTLIDQELKNHHEEYSRYLRAHAPALIRSFYASQFPSARWWGDKNPHYVDPNYRGCLALIEEIFPGTRYIHVIRDGRDVVHSLLQKGWADWQAAHDIWNSFTMNGRAFAESLSTDQYLEVRYEDVVKDEERASDAVLRFLDIPMDDEVVDFCRAQREARTAFSTPVRDLALDVDHSVWKDSLSEIQRSASLALLSSRLVELGYETPETIRRELDSLSHATR